MSLWAPKLEGWVTLVEVAERFGVTRQSVIRWAEQGWFLTLRSVGAGHVYIVQESEVDRLALLFIEGETTWRDAFARLREETVV